MMNKFVKNERKILKYIAKFRQRNPNQSQTAENICAKLNIDFDINIVVFRHLENQGLISSVHIPGNIGSLVLERDPIGITTNGIKNLENWLPQKIRFYTPVFISSLALIVSFISLLN